MLRRRRAGLAVTAAIGATVLAAPAAASAANFTVTTNADSGAGSLRQAINDANASTEADTITFDSSLSGQTIRLTSGELAIDASNYGLIIQGPAAHDITVSGDALDDGPSSDDSRIFRVNGSNPVSISGLTMAGGYVNNNDGGAVYTNSGTDVTIANSVFTGNHANGGSSSGGGSGGAIGAHGPITVTDSEFSQNAAARSGGAIFAQQGLTLRDSTVSGNDANFRGGGISGANYSCSLGGNCNPYSSTFFPTSIFKSDLDISGSTIAQNNAEIGGGIDAPALLALSNSHVQGNNAVVGGGIDSSGKYAQTKISDTTISANHADFAGGGISVAQLYKYDLNLPGSPIPTPNTQSKHALQSEITRTAISGNTSDYVGAGVGMLYLADGDHFTISHSTISGNDAQSSDVQGFGGGIYFNGAAYDPKTESYNAAIDGEFRTSDTTISGNTADVGGGVSLGGRRRYIEVLGKKGPLAQFGKLKSPTNEQLPVIGPDGSIDLQNSTISSNSASQFGGGLYLNQYADDPQAESPNLVSPTIQLTSSILADNLANGAANDAERPDGSTAGGIDSAFSLVENPANVPFVASQSSLTGIDPQLGALGDNGGPTQTQLPSTTSPVIDRGKAPARLLDDQRGQGRIVEGDAANAAGGDGADIGAVEVQNPAKNAVVPGPSQQVPDTSDHTPPKMTLKVPKSLSIAQLIRGFNVRVNCNEPCSMTFRLYASAPTGTLHSAGYNFRLLNRKIGRKSGSRRVHLQPCLAGSSSKKRTHVCRKRITAALFAKPQQSFKVKLIVAAKDKAANVSHRKAFIRIHR